MQRIDENTYIDDTLVTCAEYQLFIDEMREQAKYYQPDHWTLYRFPEGQAREPILGVRHSDAKAFCEWLTKHDKEEWQYRLSTQDETTIHPIKSIYYQSPLGYWITGSDINSRFSWVGVPPLDARQLDIKSAVHIADTLKYSEPIDKQLHSHSRILSSELERAFANIIYIAIDVEGLATIDWDTIEREDRVFELKRVIYFENETYVKDSNDRCSARPIDLDRVVLMQDPDRYTAYDLYFDLITLQERIAGHSPAFEGIRLVKERIK